MPARKTSKPPADPTLKLDAVLQSPYQYKLLRRKAAEIGVTPGTLARILILKHIGFRGECDDDQPTPSRLKVQIPFQTDAQKQAVVEFARRHGMSMASFLRDAILPKVGWHRSDDPKFK